VKEVCTDAAEESSAVRVERLSSSSRRVQGAPNSVAKCRTKQMPS